MRQDTKRKTDRSGSARSEADEPSKRQRTEQQKHSDQIPTQAASGETDQQSKSNQAASGEIEQQSKPSQVASGETDQQSKPNKAASGEIEQQSKPSQAASGETDQQSKPSQVASGETEQQSKPSQVANGETESKPSNGDRNSENNGLGEQSQQNRATAQRDGGAPKPSSAQSNQAQQDQAQLNGHRNRPGQDQQARGTMNPSLENGSAAFGPMNLSRDEIRHVQMVLKEKGFDVGEADGVLGPRTRSALIAIQREQGLEPNGKIDPPTIIALERSNRADSTITGPSLSAAGIAVSQNATPSLQAPDARIQAPIGHRQPRPSDLPPDVQRDEQLDPPSAQTQPQKQAAQTQPQNQTANRRAQAGSVPTIDARKGCKASQEALGSIFGPNDAFAVDSCLRQEQEARQQIINKWTTYSLVDKQKCIITTAYNPSYVEWITCLEMYRDVRMLRNTEKSVGAGTR
jgi:hypothetical protein